MPLYSTFNYKSNIRVSVWDITESVSDLAVHALTQKSQQRLEGMKSKVHQKGFLSIRKLLEANGYTDSDLYYHQTGKPLLTDGVQVSITHSAQYSALALAEVPVGIDIEHVKPVVGRIAHKFTKNEAWFLDATSSDYLDKLTVIWGVKEAIFKVVNEPGISFNHHIAVSKFSLDDQETTAMLDFNGQQTGFTIYFESIADYKLVVATYIS
ncbi:4'-phosphopantetheinyl transferase family protein [Flavobacterium aurantiibacter]|uniref:4'-phosphopantetheinyl transferase domain-containing protein n=1 Tax=Flavobacterium aurantiibacter TaxID=2023067 RepID=A0A256ACK1_9FLAO|nr:4'-phosphopantetheinyl transferase family protein [Flavobacterium aurantiibacter]OYQ51398.1 hypothetical protein CHX27_00360 [Flavobacterium aurantiibacter]